jgi:DDE family transposase
MGYFKNPIQAWRPTVAHSNQSSIANQAETLQRQFAQAPGLPFADLLAPQLIEELFRKHQVKTRDRIYTPLITLAMFLSQCHDEDPSLRQAVARLLAHRSVQELPPCDSDTGAYCKARQRLPEKVLADLTRHTGKQLMLDAPARWSWHGRDVKIIDGSTASMPDTPENQKEYPQMASQKPGIGFPILRLLVIFSLAVGTVLDAAFSPYKGKETSELALLRRLHDSLNDGDVVLTDRYFCSFFEIAQLQRRGVDVVMRMHQKRKIDFRRGQQRGKYDHLVVWRKPQRPKWMDVETYRQYPDELTMREVRVRVASKKCRSRIITIATTLLDAKEYRKADLAELYRRRWDAELHLRSLKTVLHMDVLRGKTPAMVRKEIWAHLLAYNLVRKVMAQAAQTHQVKPHTISFKATLQTLKAFALPLLTCARHALPAVIATMLKAIARHQVGNRPGRLEPRALKRRPKPYDLLTQPRKEARKLEKQNSCG